MPDAVSLRAACAAASSAAAFLPSLRYFSAFSSTCTLSTLPLSAARSFAVWALCGQKVAGGKRVHEREREAH